MGLSQELRELSEAGFSLHWLDPRSKKPVKANWSTLPRLSPDDLDSSHVRGNNVGVRLGEPSKLCDNSYLHVLDIDIRMDEVAEECWESLHELFPEVDFDNLPRVASGSGGKSRHFYFTCIKAFSSKKLAHSESKFRDDDGHWHWEWEIELFGTLKQVAMPPSIHPSGKPYRWEVPFDTLSLMVGTDYAIPPAAIERIVEAEDKKFAFESREPLTFKTGVLEGYLKDIPEDYLFDYSSWVSLGMALHHQFGGSQEGYRKWLNLSEQSDAFRGEKTVRETRQKWRSFGRYTGAPVTMATVVDWVKEARVQALTDQFEEDDDVYEDVTKADRAISPKADHEPDIFDEILSETFIEAPKLAHEPDIFDEILGETYGEAPKPDHKPDIFDEILGETYGEDGPVLTKPAINPNWHELLEISEEGCLKPTLHNIELILLNDERTVGLMQKNQFTQDIVQRVSPGVKKSTRTKKRKPTKQLDGDVWTVHDRVNGDLWTTERDNTLRAVLEAPKSQGGYGIKITDRDMTAAVNIVAAQNAFHPVREYLSSLKWDGVPRVEQLFTKYLNAEDNLYHRTVARLTLTAGVCRIFEPGHKFDFAVIIEGTQGKRKSTFIETLGKNWYAELDGEFSDTKQMVELMQGAWIMELPELTGFSKSDVRAIKAFFSRREDRARLAYERRAAAFPRQCVFIGSSNDSEYLRDDTGGRRFWPVETGPGQIDIEGLKAELNQLWAEAVVIYRDMRTKQPKGDLPLYIQDEAAQKYAQKIQESRRIETSEDSISGEIEEWLDEKVYVDGMNGKVQAERTETCLLEIWVDLFGGELKTLTNTNAQMLGRAMKKIKGWKQRCRKRLDKWGRQRVYVRCDS